jgi:hypothetical protein
VVVKKRQVVGISESVESLYSCAVPAETPMFSKTSWEDAVAVSAPHLDQEQTKRLLQVLRPRSTMWSGTLGKILAVRHHIPTSGPPIASQPYRVGPQSREVIDKEVKRMMDMDVIEPVAGPWPSPVVLIPKPDGSIRLCVDYRRLNAVTKNDSYALPRVDDCLDSLGDAKFFTTLDANCGYWQIEVDPSDRDKTTFTSHRGLFRFKRMPFGLMTAPATFQRAVDVILSTVRFQCALSYLDDIFVYSATFEQHMKDVAVVLRLLQDAA